MAASCLLCLNIIKDKVDSIETNSTLWQELNIAKKLEKHFWSLSTMQPNSWLCLSCWREVDDFHKFYLRIEEAHINFYKIKVEDGVECKDELTTKIYKIMDNAEESVKDNMVYCILEPEIVIDQAQPPNAIGADETGDKDTIIAQSLDNINEDDIPLNQACKRQRTQTDIANKRLKTQNDLSSKDPLAKSKKSVSDKSKRNRQHKEKPIDNKSTEYYQPNVLEIKEEPADLNDNDSVSDTESDKTDVNYVPNEDSSGNVKSKGRKSNGKYRTKREENDKFITEHFKQMFCDICQVPLKDFPDMQKHFSSTHQQQGYFVCCKRKYFYRSLLIDHIHSHLNPDHFKCNQCGKVMSDRLRLDKHVLRVHNTDESVKKHSCDECGKAFADGHYLRMHKLTHLSEEEKKFPCDECGKSYARAYILHRHTQAVHLKKFVKICHICGKFLSCTTDYKLHMNKHEGLPEPIIHCDVCGLRLTTERGLKRHKDTQHPVDGKKEHPCPKCPKVSPTLKALRKHISTMHVKGYDHKCTICEKAFKRAEVLREHMASHAGTSLYTCPWCPKTFNSNGNMHAHRKKIHPKEWEEAKRQKYSGNLKPNINTVPENVR